MSLLGGSVNTGAGGDAVSRGIYGPGNTSEGKVELKSLAELKAYAMKSSAVLAQRKEDARRRKKEDQQLARVLALPALCDTLQTMTVIKKHKKRTIFPLSGLVASLSESMRLSPEEVRAQLRVAVSTVPDFVTLIEADKLVPEARIKVNTDIPYAHEMRKKILHACQATEGEEVVAW